MTDVLRIGAAFALIVLLLRLKWNLGGVMLLVSVVLGGLYRIGPMEQLRIMAAAAVDHVTLNLIVGLVLIMALENVIRKRGLLAKMTGSLGRLARDRRVAMAVLPGVIGLLPSAGGAAFSAPMVQEAAGGIEIAPERRAFINYWFRHIWEYVSPLYPGVVLAAAITKIPIPRLLLYQSPLPAALVTAGVLLCFRGVRRSDASEQPRQGDGRDLAVSLLPIALALVLVIAFGLGLGVSMTIVVATLFLAYRYRPSEIAVTLRESLSLHIITMVLGVMVFKGMLGATGAIEALPRFFRESGVPPVIVFFSLPFIVGLLTGITVAFVGSTFPLLVAMTGGAPDPAIVTFAFAGGFAGVMLSPTHLCLLLTVRYFNADIAGTYRLLYLPTAIVFLVGAGMFLLERIVFA